MNIRIKIFFASILLISSVAYAKQNPCGHAGYCKTNDSIIVKQKSIQPISNSQQRQRILQSFTAINTYGPTNYQIVVGGKTNFIEVFGNPTLIPTMQYCVTNGTLQLSYKNKVKLPLDSEPLLVVLHATQLNQINQRGTGSITVNYLTPQLLRVNKTGPGNLIIKGRVKLVQLNAVGPGIILADKIKTSDLFMNIRTSGMVKLTGTVALAILKFSGSGNLQMYWVNSNNLIVRTAGRSTVSLAGIAELVNAFAYGHSHLNLRFLRTKTMFVKSYGDASVDVWVQDNLFTLASNNSNIYYYNYPDYKSRMMQDSGTVLTMADIPGAIATFNTQGSFH